MALDPVVTTEPGRRPIRIATRASELAIWQAERVASLLRSSHSGLSVELVELSTEGDRRTDLPLAEIGGKGVFAKEVQAAVLDDRADIAVHSAKDLPALTPQGLVIAAVPERGDPRDALVGATLEELSPGDVVATGSARRRVQLAEMVPGLRFEDLRGNMATRLAKADGFQAIVVAAVALERLGRSERIAETLDAKRFVPQVGQGALAVECRDDDESLLELLGSIEHPRSRRELDCERAFLDELGGDCSLPAGAHATEQPDGELLVGGVLAPRGGAEGVEVDPSEALTVPTAPRRATLRGSDPVDLGTTLARELRDGA